MLVSLSLMSATVLCSALTVCVVCALEAAAASALLRAWRGGVLQVRDLLVAAVHGLLQLLDLLLLGIHHLPQLAHLAGEFLRSPKASRPSSSACAWFVGRARWIAPAG